MTGNGALMRAEIFEQPQVLRNLLASAEPALIHLNGLLAERSPAIAVLAARGSSDNASTYGKYLFESQFGLPTALAAPSLFTLYRAVPRLKAALVIGVSQSGGSLDVVEVVRNARAQGALTVGITNVAHSALDDAAEIPILLHAGAESALAATKTVTAQCLVYAMIVRKSMPDDSVEHVPTEVERALTPESAIQSLVAEWLETSRCAVIGRGFTYAAAQETALKLKETCFLSAEAYSGADFMHGPLALLEPGFQMLVLVNSDPTVDTSVELIVRARQRGATVTVWANGSDALSKLQAARITPQIEIHAQPLTSPISFIVLGQLFAYHLSIARGNNPDSSRGVSKVTVTK